MRRLIDRCAGIDVGQALLVVGIWVFDGKGTLAQEVRSFGATTPGLGGVAGLVDLARGDARGDGVDRRVLEGALFHVGGQLRGAAGQCCASQSTSGAARPM